MDETLKDNKILAAVALAALLFLYGSFLARDVNLVTADVGRHIKNGEALLQGENSVLKTNFYSYTQPDFPTTNHHWGSGVIFYLIWRTFGFGGLHVFFIILSLAAFSILFWFTQKRAGPGLAALAALLAIPLIVERVEIRPEVFSYL